MTHFSLKSVATDAGMSGLDAMRIAQQGQRPLPAQPAPVAERMPTYPVFPLLQPPRR